MTINGVGTRSAQSVQSLVDMRNHLDDLQGELGTGQKSTTYAGIGFERGLAVGLRGHVASLNAYDDGITNVGIRLKLAQVSLGELDKMGHEVKTSALQPGAIDSNGTTLAQRGAYGDLGEILGLLNTQAGERYLFSGRATDKPAVETFDHVLTGDGTRAGFKQVLDERNQADLGASGLGRLLVTAPSVTSVSVAEDVAGTPFGFKLAGIVSTLTGATVTGPAGAPPGVSVDLAGGNPNAGETIKFQFTLPDGTNDSLTLTATASATPAANEFTIGTTPTATAANLKAVTITALGTLAATSLSAASAAAAANDFFNIDSTHPPQRVAGPPFTSATALTAGTATNTVSWYIGEDGTDPARGTATAQVDPSIAVSYGVRANETGIRWLVQNVALLAAVTFTQSDPNAAARNVALRQRVVSNLEVPPSAKIAGAQSSLSTAAERHKQTKSKLLDMVQQIEGVPQEQVAAQILALQTSLQASLQTTAMLYKMSLINYM